MSQCRVVIPCYNEETRLDAGAFLSFLNATPDVGLLFVNDGSRDGTAAILERIVAAAPRRTAALHLVRNGGKAEAVRQGLLTASRNALRVGFWDADLATPLEAIPEFDRILAKRGELQAVIGSRLSLAGRHIERSPLRRRLGGLFAFVTTRLFNLGLHDTQCGAKLFRVTPALTAALANPFHSRWLFDIELLLRLEALISQPIRQAVYELPLEEWHDVAGSKLKRSDFLKAASELLTIARTRPRLDPALCPYDPILLPLPTHDNQNSSQKPLRHSA